MYPTVEKEMGMLDRVEYKKVRRNSRSRRADSRRSRSEGEGETGR